MSQNIFAYFSISEHSAYFSLFQKKTPILVTARGFAPPPPFTDWSVTYIHSFIHLFQYILYTFVHLEEFIYSTVHIKLCEDIGIFIKNYKSTNPGSNKVANGPL